MSLFNLLSPEGAKMEVDIIPQNAQNNGHVIRQEEEIADDQDAVAEAHQAMVSNLNRCSGSAMYTFGDNIVQCSIFGPNPLAGNMNLLKKNYFNVYLYPLGKIKNLTKGRFCFFCFVCFCAKLIYISCFFE